MTHDMDHNINRQCTCQMLIFCGTGSQLGRREAIGLLWTAKSTALAFRDEDDVEGFRVLWEATGEMEEVAKTLGMDVMDAPGLWLFTTVFLESDYLASIRAESWDYLTENLTCEHITALPCMGSMDHQTIMGALSGSGGWVPA